MNERPFAICASYTDPEGNHLSFRAMPSPAERAVFFYMNNLAESILTEDQSMQNPYAPPKYPVLIVISGPSGVGKDTVVRNLITKREDFYFVVTATDRPPREGEVEGVDYFFVSTEKFEEMIANDELLEYAVVHQCYKGVPKSQIRHALNSDMDVIMRVDPQGAATLKRIIPDATFVFLLAESEEELTERLRGRNSETDVSFSIKLEIAREELTRIPEFDYCVVNRTGKLEETVDQILAIITAERCRVGRRPIQL